MKNEYEVAGAGKLVLDLGSTWHTGGASGIQVGCSWGKYGLAGGVLDKTAVKMLVLDLQGWLEEQEIKIA